jgi:hypothetical protein
MALELRDIFSSGFWTTGVDVVFVLFCTAAVLF